MMTGAGKSGSKKAISDEERRIIKGHSLASLSTSRRDPLFDPTGLRNWTRKNTNCQPTHTIKDDLRLPERNELAASIDEEKAYAWFHGYVAYRFGYRADVITTWAAMKSRFGRGTGDSPDSTSPNHNSTPATPPHGYWLLLEDMSLNFADRERDTHLLDLKKERAAHCPRLDSKNPDIEDSEHRILITTGQTSYGDNSVLRENRAYLRKKAHGRGKVVLKPTGGLFDLWEQCGLFRRDLGSKPCGRTGNGWRLGNAPEFCWPPKLTRTENRERQGGHGAPGRLLLVTDRLIERAGALFDKAATVGDAVRGAVLATDALELTGGRTPTTAIEALSLKHRFEVLAECQFSGVEHHIETKSRMDEIRLETEAISRWFDKSQREKAALNAQMHILNELVRLLREHNQFDEEQICVRRVRALHTTLWMREQPLRYGF